MAHQRALAHHPDPVPRRCAGGRARRGARRRVGQARARPEPPAAGGGMIAKPASIASRHRDTGSSYPVSLAPRKGGSPLPAPRLKSPLTIRSFSHAAPVLLAISLLMCPQQTDAGPSSVTLNKFDPGGFQGTPNG